MKRTKTIGIALAGVLSSLIAAPAVAQEDPTELGGGKKPYVLLIIDSSASMEYTDDGDNRYPIRDCGDDNLCPGETGYPGPDLNEGDGTGDWSYANTVAGFEIASEWFPGDYMELTDIHASTDFEGFEGFGTCWLWEPTTSTGACPTYERPAWKNSAPAGFTIALPPTSWHTDKWDAAMAQRINLMRASGSLVWRYASLQDMSQPRHVTIKEVLGGDMILLPDDAVNMSANTYNSANYGPGCWFVPRQRDASIQPTDDSTYCAGSPAFENFPDHNQPLPHFQEVWDLQKRNGVLDTLGGSAIFGVAAFDGYKDGDGLDDVTGAPIWQGFNTSLNDEFDGSYPQEFTGIRDADLNEDSGDCNGDSTIGDYCYNLGIWQVVGPKRLDIPATLLPEVAAYAQIAINDTGYLRQDTIASENDDFTLFTDSKKSVGNAYLGATFSNAFGAYADDVQLGKQPIARATPLAAAIHDAYQFMSHGQRGNHPIGEQSGGNPDGDAFANCRPKHVVMLTDGKPEPEYQDATTLSEAFDYNESFYPYGYTENEIKGLVLDIDDTVPPGVADHEKYGVRVHVVGLNLDSDDQVAREKMVRMAIEGQSCAQFLLPPSRIPFGYAHADGTAGTCVPGTGCLVPQDVEVNGYAPGYSWTHPSTSLSYACTEFPALILDNNSAPELAAAMSSFLSSLIESSGLASRTRLVVANRLDDATIQSGGQYRFYSGVRIGGSPWWKGVINRATLRCDNAPVDELPLDEQVQRQVQVAGPNYSDNRRIWTSVPDSAVWDYSIVGGGQPMAVSTYATNPTFPFDYRLTKSVNDEFVDTYLGGIPDTDKLLGTRTPFERDDLESAGAGASTVVAALDIYEDYNVSGPDDLEDVINVFRARIPERVSVTQGGDLALDESGNEQARVLGAILNSNPVVVGPPSLDLAIGSYRNFRARYADRPTMLYVSSMDGLLHALHTGTLDDRVQVRAMKPANTPPSASTEGPAEEQREAWAYMPWMIHRDLASKRVSQAYFMDGTPVVKDVRLCNQDPAFNQNDQACNVVCDVDDGCTVYPSADQWRTVLVQSRGLAGTGYYAMDVTRPGGLQANLSTETLNIQNPDPILLWEFDREWEKAQLQYMYPAQPARISSTAVAPDNTYVNTAECGNDVSNFWMSPLMGLSVSEPEIATIIMEDNSGDRQQRPVAVFGGGALDPNNTECGGPAGGMAIYIVDLQTGNMIRRFTHYDNAGTPTSFVDNADGSRFVGSPALYDSSTGSIATRGFIGDDSGRLFKIDLLAPDPADWEVSLFFDPAADVTLDGLLSAAIGAGAKFGPGGFKPAIALNRDREVMVVYGLGETGDVVTNGQGQAVIALTEEFANPAEGKISWAEVFAEGEKVTGAPIIFNGQVFFPTYALPSGDRCLPGYARIWGLQLGDPDTTNLTTAGIFAGNAVLAGNPAGISVDPDAAKRWYGPVDPTLVRGLTITLGEQCSIDNIGSDNPTVGTEDRPKPQLVAQTSGDVNTDLNNTDRDPGANAGTNALDRIVLEIDPPTSKTIPLSWTLVF